MSNNKNNSGGVKRQYANNRKMSFTGKCDVRLTAEENSLLDRLAERNGVSRSDVMRKALKDFGRWNGEKE